MPINLDGYEDLRLLRAFFEEASFVPESFRMQGAGGSSPPISTSGIALLYRRFCAFASAELWNDRRHLQSV